MLWLQGGARVVAVAGVVAGLVPVHLTPTMTDRTETYLEFFRYASFALAWIALLSGAGIAALASFLARGLGSPVIARVLPIGFAMAMLVTPVVNRGYLGLRYGPAIDEAVFREALTQVPSECELIVPDDDRELDVVKRYVEITREVFVVRRDTPAPGSVIGLSKFLAERRRSPAGCRFFYRGTYCHDGFEGDPPPGCREIVERYGFEPVWSRTIVYRSHRLVSRPGRAARPWYEASLVLTLFKAGGPGAG